MFKISNRTTRNYVGVLVNVRTMLFVLFARVFNSRFIMLTFLERSRSETPRLCVRSTPSGYRYTITPVSNECRWYHSMTWLSRGILFPGRRPYVVSPGYGFVTGDVSTVVLPSGSAWLMWKIRIRHCLIDAFCVDVAEWTAFKTITIPEYIIT